MSVGVNNGKAWQLFLRRAACRVVGHKTARRIGTSFRGNRTWERVGTQYCKRCKTWVK